MRKPILASCISFIITLTFAVVLPNKYLYAVAAILAATAFVCLLFNNCRKSRDILTVSLFSLLAVFVLCVFNGTSLKYAKTLSGKTTNITGTVIEGGVSSNDNVYYVIKLDKVNSKDSARNVNVKLYCQNNDVLNDYDKISVKVNFFTNDSSSAYDEFYLSSNILASAITTDDVKVTNADEFSLLREICKIRDNVIMNIRIAIPTEQGDVICGILFGERDKIDDETTLLFSASGISHLLAVSGLHLTIIVTLVDMLLKLFYVSKGLRSAVSLILSFAMMVITGFTPSIVRACIMTTFMLTAQMMRRDYDTATALGISAVIICLVNPYAITNVGFQLSFAATVGLVVSQKIIENDRMRFSLKTVSTIRLIYHELLTLIMPCIFAFLFTIPITVAVFGKFATYSPIVNFLIAPLLPISTAFILITAVLSAFPSNIIFEAIYFITKELISIIMWIADLFRKLPLSEIYFESELTIIITAAIVCIMAIAFFSKRRKRNTICALLLSIVMIFSVLVANKYFYADTASISVLSDSSVIVQAGEKTFVNGYTRKTAYELDKLLSKSQNKNISFISSENGAKRDIGSLKDFANNNKVDIIAVPKKTFTSMLPLNITSSSIQCVNEDFIFKFDDICVSTDIIGKNSVVHYDIGGFKISYLTIKSPQNLAENFKCDLLIANSGALSYLEKYKSKYFVLSEEIENESGIRRTLKNYDTKYLGDCTDATFYIKNGKLYKKTKILQ